MPLNVFANKDEAVKVPDAIIGPSGTIFTNYDLSADAALPQNILGQTLSGKTFQLDEIPIGSVPKYAESFVVGRGFYYPRDMRPVLSSDPISQHNAELISEKIATDAFVHATTSDKTFSAGLDGGFQATDLGKVLSQYRVSADTIKEANRLAPIKLQNKVSGYEQQLHKESSDIGTLIGNIWTGAIAAVASIFAPPVGLLYAQSQAAINLGVQATSGKKITVEQVAMTEGPILGAAGLLQIAPAAETPALLQVRNVPEGFQAARLGVSVPTFTLPADLAAQVPVTTGSVLSTTSTQSPLWFDVAQKAVNYGPVAATAGPSVIKDLTQGKVGSFFADLGRAFGLPIPKAPGDTAGIVLKNNQPASQPAGGYGGGGNMNFTPANPLDYNTGQWIIGAVLIGFLLFVILRK